MLAAAYSTQAPALDGHKDTQSAMLQLQTEPPIPETVLPIGVTMYGAQGNEAVEKLTQVVNEFPEVWKDTGTFVDIPQEEWMKIPLRSDWESRIPMKGARVYPLGTQDRQQVDKTFNQLHDLG